LRLLLFCLAFFLDEYSGSILSMSILLPFSHMFAKNWNYLINERKVRLKRFDS
jgi:hypothetical protein